MNKPDNIDYDHYLNPLIDSIKVFLPQFIVLTIVYFVSPLLAFILGQFLVLFMTLIGRYAKFARIEAEKLKKERERA